MSNFTHDLCYFLTCKYNVGQEILCDHEGQGSHLIKFLQFLFSSCVKSTREKSIDFMWKQVECEAIFGIPSGKNIWCQCKHSRGDAGTVL